MKKVIVLLLILSVFLSSCSYFQSKENVPQTEEKETVEQPIDSEDWFTSDMVCNDEDGDDKNTKGKAILTYSTGQKESFNDYCPEKEEEAFKVFVVEYTCDGNKPKENLRKCDNNMTCSKGVCV